MPPSAAAGLRSRPYWLHVPAGYSRDNPVPLILALHGGYGTALGMERVTGFSALADHDEFLVVYPQGLAVGGRPGGVWNTSGPRDPFAMGIDDGGYIARVLAAVEAGYCVDTARVDATGFSNGAGMVGYLACVLPGRIDAFAPVEAVFFQTPGGCRPAHPATILDVHSVTDPVAPYWGVPARATPEYFAPSIPSWLGQWALRDGCEVSSAVVSQPASSQPAASQPIAGFAERFAGCDDGAVVAGYRLPQGGHVWPRRLGGVSGSRFILNFFAAHRLTGRGVRWAAHPAVRVPALPGPAVPVAAVRQFRLPTPGAEPVDVVAGPDGSIWFTEFGADKVGRISASGVLSEYRVPQVHAEPYQLAVGPGGVIWFTEWLTGKVGRISPGGRVAQVALPKGSAGGLGIAVGADGTVWVADQAGRIDRIAPDGRSSVIAPPHGIGGTLALTRGAAGSVWCTIFAGFYERSRVIDQLSQAGRWERTVSLDGRGADLDALAAGPGGAVWLADYGLGRIGEVTPGGGLHLFAVPGGSGELNDLTIGPDGAAWFTEQSGLIGRLAPGGSLRYVVMDLPGSGPNGIAAGPARTIWVALTGANAIARITY